MRNIRVKAPNIRFKRDRSSDELRETYAAREAATAACVLCGHPALYRVYTKNGRGGVNVGACAMHREDVRLTSGYFQ